MRRRFIITAFLLILILSSNSLFSPVFAQDSPTWPPDPAVIFAEGVEVIGAEKIAPRPIQSTPQPSETRCGRLTLDPPDAEVAMIEKDEQYFICELATGALSQPIPYSIVSTVNASLKLSPDKKWTWFTVYKDMYYHLYAYERSTQKFVDLGKIPFFENYFQQFGWASNTELYLLTRDSPEWSNMFAYVATVPIENSLREAMMSYRFWINYYDDPPRFEQWQTPSSDYWTVDQPSIDCTRSVYDIGTRRTKVYHYGNLCRPEYTADSDAEYYRDVQGDGKAWFVRFDIKTRERRNFYYGEIEHVFWVAEDEHYALFALDNNGIVNCKPGFEYVTPDLQQCWFVTEPIIVLIDLTTGQTLFSAVADLSTLEMNHNPVTAIDPHTMTISYSLEYRSRSYYLQIENGHTTVQILDGDPVIYLEDHRLILQLDGSWEHLQYMVYDPVARTKRLITKPNDYFIYLTKVEGDTAIVEVAPTRGYADEPPSPKMQYTISLPS